MNITKPRRQAKGLSACGIATLLLGTSLAIAKGYDIAIDTVNMSAEPVAQALPAFPDSKDVKKRQEGWVKVNFVVSPEGRAVDAIVVHSTGGKEFEKSALEAIQSWEFKPSDAELGGNTVALRFEHSDDSGKASRNFTRWYRMVLTELASEKTEKARTALERARKAGGWNLYEATILDVLDSQVSQAEGDKPRQLAAVRRALAMQDEAALTVKTKRKLLQNAVELEVESMQFAAARDSLEKLRALKGSSPAVEALASAIEQIQETEKTWEPISVSAEIDCECEESVWSHRPLRRSFAIENLDGELARVEARCESFRLTSDIQVEKTFELPQDATDCEIFVFGEDGTSFDFIELAADAAVEGGVAQVQP